jgi:serine/threonine-protein kinase
MSSTLGAYTLLYPLGQGGSAQAWVALSRGPHGFQQRVVIKRLLPELANDVRLLRGLIDEAKLLAALNHPNIVAVLDLAKTSDEHFMVLEHVDGADLAVMLDATGGKGLPPAIVATIMIDVLRGLHAAHKAVRTNGEALRIVHRDVSPQNIFVSRAGVAKIGDFGVARAVGRSQATRAGELRGKVAYMSPEQARGAPIDARSDLFACGLVLLEALTGRRVYDAATLDDALTLARAGVVSVSSAIAPALRAVIARATAISPEARYESADAMARAIEDAMASAPHDEVGPLAAAAAQGMVPTFVERELTLQPLTEIREPSSRRAWALAAATICIVIALAARLLVPAERPPAPAVSVTPEPASVPAPPPSPPPNVTPGYLTLTTIPWSYVRIDGKSPEQITPILSLPLSHGLHKLHIHSPGVQRSMTVEVRIVAGATTKHVFDLRERGDSQRAP